MHRKYRRSIGSILHLTDFSRGSEVAYAHALRLAVGVQGSLEILHVEREAEEDGETSWDRYPTVRDTLCRWQLLPAGAKRSDVARLGVRISKSICRAGEAVTGVLEHLERRDTDLAVMATHRRAGLARWLHRSVAESLSHEPETGTLLVPYEVDGFVDLDSGSVTLRRILIPIDVTPSPLPAISAVVDLVEAIAPGDVEVRLLHVGDPSGMPSPALPATNSCVWNWQHRSGNVVDEICADAEENAVDLIAMTTSGHDGFLDVLRGSTTERVLHRAQCPVLSVHAAD